MFRRLHHSALFAVLVLLSGCAGSPGYNVVVPLAKSNILGDVQLGEQQFEIRYQMDAQGQRIYKTVPSAGLYAGSDRESYEQIKSTALQRMVRNAVDEVNGVFIMAKTEVHQKAIIRDQNAASFQDLKDETISKLVGFARYSGEPQCERTSLAGDVTQVVCKSMVEVPLVDVVKTTF